MVKRAPARLVLDTSLFVNPDTQHQFGPDIQEAVSHFLQIAQDKQLELYMPISIYRELSHFAPPSSLAAFRRVAVVRAPDLHHMRVPAAILHSFIRDLRNRVNQGLRVAERAIRSDRRDNNVRWLRERYREALRSGIVDSVEDLDVVLLAKEVKGAILSADQGIANMAEELGLEVFTAAEFLDRYAPETGGDTVV